MYRKIVSAMYIINIVSQAIFTLAMPIAFGFGISWLLVNCASAPTFVYAIFITVGAIGGFYSMIKFIISAMAALERLEKSREDCKKTGKTGNNQ